MNEDRVAMALSDIYFALDTIARELKAIRLTFEAKTAKTAS